MLLSIHILFLREHNRVARLIEDLHPRWSDEKVFQAARKYVIAELQQIIYDEFLFWLLGETPFPHYEGYDDSVDPRIHIFFSTVAFRYGHSEVGDYLDFAEKGGYGLFPHVLHSNLSRLYFNPSMYGDGDISPTAVWIGMSKNIQQSMDAQFSDSVRNYMFLGKHKRPQHDLLAVDVQRARDHGIPLCNEVRKAYNLKPYKSWEKFRVLKRGKQDPKQLLAQLEKLYDSPSDTESFICGLAEDWVESNVNVTHVRDYSNLGELFEVAVIDQFYRLRAGDRFWHQLHLDTITLHGDLPSLKTRTLNQIIIDNSGVDIQLGKTVFF